MGQQLILPNRCGAIRINEIDTYQSRKVIWINYYELLAGEMPENNWICLMASSKSKPNSVNFDKFTRDAIKNRTKIRPSLNLSKPRATVKRMRHIPAPFLP